MVDVPVHDKMSVSIQRSIHELKRIWLVGVFVLGCIVVIAHYPAVSSGFSADDYVFVERAGRATNIAQYLSQSFDLRVNSAAAIRRPLIGALFLIEYRLFRDNTAGYHLFNIFLHVINAVLLAWLVMRLTRHSLLSILSGFFYGFIPIKAFSVLWVSTITDVASTFFYLLAMCLWLQFLTGKRHFYWLTLCATIAAMFCKENVIGLPISLLLLDRLVVLNRAVLLDLVRRYVAFGLVTVFYLLLYWSDVQGIALRNPDTAVIQSVSNYAKYMTLIAFPWTTKSALNDVAVWGMAAIFWLIYGALTWKTRDRRLMFLGTQTLVTLTTYLPLALFYETYLYLSATISAILWAVFTLGTFWRLQSPATRLLKATAVLLLLLHSTTVIATAAANLREFSRVGRVPFRVISTNNPVFLPGTFLYFIEPPTLTPISHLSSMFFLRYGDVVTVGDIDAAGTNRLRDQTAAFVYYFEDKDPIKVAVSKGTVEVVPRLPVSLGEVGLQDLEISSTMVRRGDPVVLLLYWQANRRTSKDYTVFVHLLNEQSQIVMGQDGPPGSGMKPTSEWSEGKTVVDAHVIQVPKDVKPGNYRLAVGLYFLPTLERLSLLDANGQPIAGQFVIESFVIGD